VTVSAALDCDLMMPPLCSGVPRHHWRPATAARGVIADPISFAPVLRAFPGIRLSIRRRVNLEPNLLPSPLHHDHVNIFTGLERRLLPLPNSTGGGRCTFPVSDEVWAAFLTIPTVAGNRCVFLGSDGQPMGFPWTASENVVKSAARVLLPNLTSNEESEATGRHDP
jgi:hypothetical protein